jgi:acyl-CoA thioesterase
MDDTITFVDLMALHTLQSEQEAQKFMSLIPAFNAGGGAAYGGHVYAQAVWAAAQTVGEGMIVHVRLPLSVFISRDMILGYSPGKFFIF